MNIFYRILPVAFLCAALCLPLSAQDEEGGGGEAPQEDTQPAQAGNETPQQPAAKKAAPKPAAAQAGKKNAKKKAAVKKAKPVSEYKFTSDNPTPAYKFDKKSDPIVKEKKKKKKPAEKNSDGSSKSIPKLQKVKSFNDAGSGAGGDVKLPDGVNIPGIGGK